jgi:hypothetical protein
MSRFTQTLLGPMDCPKLSSRLMKVLDITEQPVIEKIRRLRHQTRLKPVGKLPVRFSAASTGLLCQAMNSFIGGWF